MSRFNDGENIDTSGPLRVLELKDGFYVVGKGMLVSVKCREEAEEFIKWKTELGKSARLREGRDIPAIDNLQGYYTGS